MCPRNSAEYACCAATVAARYAPYGAHAYEIWNEQNTRNFWLPAADPTRHTDLLKWAIHFIATPAHGDPPPEANGAGQGLEHSRGGSQMDSPLAQSHLPCDPRCGQGRNRYYGRHRTSYVY